ncbi:MAG: DUF2442 domain-containing protein [Kiritimatiellia bacterium]|jgi:hypothetical protein
MHYVISVEYAGDYCLTLGFEDGTHRQVDLANHLHGEMFEPLKDLTLFKTARLNADIDTVTWDNGADFSPDFLYEIGETVDHQVMTAAESRASYSSDKA